MTNTVKSSGKSMEFKHIALPLVISALIMNYVTNYGDFFQIIPYFYLITGFRSAAYESWQLYAPINTAITHPPMHIPEIQASEYSFDKMRQATANWRHPVVVRGLFNGTKAVEQWTSREYLPSVLGDQTIPIVVDGRVGTLQDNRKLVSFRDSYFEMFDSNYSTKYLFFPVKSRFTFNGSEAGAAERLNAAGNALAKQDLDLERIRPGFATSSHGNYAGAQYVIGKSTEDKSKATTGSDWHCAMGNNWFIQVAGRKRWQFVDPAYSAYMSPLKGGLFNMWTGNKNIAAVEKYIPTSYVDLYPGDVIYNPDWQWHKITNYGGLSIGVPLREGMPPIAFRNNFFFTSVVISNLLLDKIGVSIGFPPPSQATEHDN